MATRKTTPKPAPALDYEQIDPAAEAQTFAYSKAWELTLTAHAHRVQARALAGLALAFLEPLDLAAQILSAEEMAARTEAAADQFKAIAAPDPAELADAIGSWTDGYLAGVEREHLQHLMLADAADTIGEPSEAHRFAAVACAEAIAAAKALRQ